MSNGTPAMQVHFLFQIFEAPDTELRVVDFTATESISSPYRVELTLASEDELGFDAALGKAALLTIASQDADRYFHGIINQFTQVGISGRFNVYRASMVPSLWLLSLEQDCRIFQDMSVPDIVGAILQDRRISTEGFVFRLQGQYEPRTYCVQYRETDLNFISRLLEEEGIFYFFEHAEDKHLLVFGDGTVNYQPILGQARVPFHVADARVAQEEAVSSFILSRRIHPEKVILRDFNFENPALDLSAPKPSGPSQELEIYDYPGEYLAEARGSSLAQIRLQEAVMFKDKGEGQGVCPRFTTGFVFTLTDHELDDINQEYLLVEVAHTGSQTQALDEESSGGGFDYSNHFLAIPSSVTFRPERNAPKPVVEGIQTAIVVGPSGEEIYTDEYGRVKVQFHWDRRGGNDETSSCWMRVSQLWAGTGWGAMFIPRIGQEVIVDFLEGDPDRPLITGRVYHRDNMPPYNLPDEKTKSTIKSYSSPDGEGFNEVRFDDLKGEEQVFIHAEKNQDIRTKKDRKEWVGQDSHLIVVRNQLEKVEGDKHLAVNGDQNEKVDGTVSLEAGMDIQEKAGGKHALDAAQEIHLKAGMKVIIEAGTQISLKVGGNFVDIGPSGVSIQGTMVNINSGGSAGSGSGSSPDSPQDPSEADTAEPGRATQIDTASPASPSPQARALSAASESGTPLCET